MGDTIDKIAKPIHDLLPETKEKKSIKWLLIPATVFLSLIIIFFVSSAAYAEIYKNKIFVGIRLNDKLTLSGLDKEQAEKIINGQFKETYGNGLNFAYKQKNITIKDEENKLFYPDLKRTVDTAYAAGRSSNFFFNYASRLYYLIQPKEITLNYYVDKIALEEKLRAELTSEIQPAKEASFAVKVQDEATKNYSIEFLPEQAGEIFNFDEANQDFQYFADRLDPINISLTSQKYEPVITLSEAQKREPEIRKIIALAPITLKYADKEWLVLWNDFTHWVSLSVVNDNQITVSIDKEIVNNYLQALAQDIDQPALNAKLIVTNDRATDFQLSQNGIKLNIDKSLEKITDELINKNNTTIELIADEVEPEIKTEAVNDMGIKEKVGEGFSDFSGSPVNRRHNIGVGVAKLNGLIIKPGEEFSLMKYLSPIDASSGYLPELVIKGNKTVPESGGGLCQIGTTIFRVALAAGLPITERAAHRYRVIYYEPAGTDATIYDPRPDVRFINDTGNYLLLQTKMYGNTLRFELWGTADGRKVLFEGLNKTDKLTDLKPQIFNIVQPGAPREIETEDLKPGEKKRQETAHAGADALFYRTVTKADGTEVKDTWKSHYVPWQAVYLIGVDPAKKAAEAAEAAKLAPDATVPDPNAIPPVDPVTPPVTTP